MQCWNSVFGLLMSAFNPGAKVDVGTHSKWSVGEMLDTGGYQIEIWGKAIVAIIGIGLIILGVVMIAKGMLSAGKAAVNWVLAIVIIFFGAVFAFSGGWSIVEQIGKGGYSTVDTIGNHGGYAYMDGENGSWKLGDGSIVSPY